MNNHMKTFIYTVENKSTRRGFDQTVRVYRIKRNRPEFVSKDDQIQRRSSHGETAIAHQMVARELGIEMGSPYRIKRNDVDIIRLG